MNKTKILILAICAVVVIAGSVLGVTLLRDGIGKSDEVSTTTTTIPPETEYQFNGGFGLGSDDPNVYQPVVDNTEASDNSLATTLQQIAQTTKKVVSNKTTTKKSATTKKASSKTTTKKSGTASYVGDDKLVDQVIGPNGKQFLGYRYDAEGDFYYTDDKDCWQKNAGYNEIYDNLAAGVMMNIDQIRIRFTYGTKDWMIQLWKGQYGNLLIGAEIGVYTTKAGTYTGEIGNVNHYDCADKEDWLKMEMTCYWSENNSGTYKKAFHREYDEYWWATGFVKGQLTKYTRPRTELKVKARITFKSTEMANLFVLGLREAGFARALGSNQLADDSFFQKDADVWLLWSTKYHECFVGYGEEAES